jgi:hypothetical protein
MLFDPHKLSPWRVRADAYLDADKADPEAKASWKSRDGGIG